MDVLMSGSIVVLLLVAVVSMVLFLIPAIIAIRVNHPNKLAIVLINVLLGGTVIGWIVALIWALTPNFPDNRQNKP